MSTSAYLPIVVQPIQPHQLYGFVRGSFATVSIGLQFARFRAFVANLKMSDLSTSLKLASWQLLKFTVRSMVGTTYTGVSVRVVSLLTSCIAARWFYRVSKQTWAGLGLDDLELKPLGQVVVDYLFTSPVQMLRGGKVLVDIEEIRNILEANADESGEYPQSTTNESKAEVVAASRKMKAARSTVRMLRWVYALNSKYPRYGRIRDRAEDLIVSGHIRTLFDKGIDWIDEDGCKDKHGPVRFEDRLRMTARVTELYWRLSEDMFANLIAKGEVEVDSNGVMRVSVWKALVSWLFPRKVGATRA